jgi:hypothetical protein
MADDEIGDEISEADAARVAAILDGFTERYRQVAALDSEERRSLLAAAIAVISIRRHLSPREFLAGLDKSDGDYISAVFTDEAIDLDPQPPREPLVYDDPFRFASAQDGRGVITLIGAAGACAALEDGHPVLEALAAFADQLPEADDWEEQLPELSSTHQAILTSAWSIDLDHAIDKHGWFAFYVFDAKDGTLPVLYTTGFPTSKGAPNIVVTGLSQEISYAIAGSAYDLLKQDVGLVGLQEEILSVPIWLLPASRSELDLVIDHRRGDAGESEFVVAVWPDGAGRFPWDEGCDAEIAAAQPLAPRQAP